MEITTKVYNTPGPDARTLQVIEAILEDSDAGRLALALGADAVAANPDAGDYTPEAQRWFSIQGAIGMLARLAEKE